MTTTANQTLASIVTSQHRSVHIFEKYDLDFCCRGKRTLSEACLEKGLPLEALIRELDAINETVPQNGIDFSTMTAAQLISYILINHHFYVKQSMPAIAEHANRVATKHGDHFPNMRTVEVLFGQIKNEMELHMEKEEKILFPRIIETEQNSHAEVKKNIPPKYLSGPITIMEHEHDNAGEILYRIRELTNNYTAPLTACTTFRLLLNELKAFEEDLHRHVHLENNILFPLAEKIRLESTV